MPACVPVPGFKNYPAFLIILVSIETIRTRNSRPCVKFILLVIFKWLQRSKIPAHSVADRFARCFNEEHGSFLITRQARAHAGTFTGTM